MNTRDENEELSKRELDCIMSQKLASVVQQLWEAAGKPDLCDVIVSKHVVIQGKKETGNAVEKITECKAEVINTTDGKPFVEEAEATTKVYFTATGEIRDWTSTELDIR